ncbi:hypothetical protein MANES_18G145610v8 [Manihot esculenta]|uniref:Uncharacterized protein n=1 Tax=Manihot esculenta TaxID=3983 RepID=A0ACB7G123_MANES|nr:hypothetical protein MANES_18G145610v8 [Manihot esculenta]
MWMRKNNKEVRWPPKLNPEKAERRDMTKYCHFHEDHRHTMKEFGPADKTIGFFQNNIIIVNIHLNRYEMRRVLVDTGSSINLLTSNVFNKLGLDKNNLVKVFYPLVGLGDKTVAVLSTINLPLVFGDGKHKRELYTEFIVVHILLAYNVILIRPILNCHDIFISMGAICLKLPAPEPSKL